MDINTRQNEQLFQDIILKDKPEDVLNFFEILVNNKYFPISTTTKLAQLFEKHHAPYRLDLDERPFIFLHRTSKEESDATLQSIAKIRENGFPAALTHLRQAAIHINKNQFPDSIHDSISAVESVARSSDPQYHTLSRALKKLQKDGIIQHIYLKEALDKLYAYTCDV